MSPSSGYAIARLSIRCLSLLILAACLLPQASASASFKALYSFQGGSDGDFPGGALVFDTSGNIYGATTFGGTGSCTAYNGNGCGTIFELKRLSNGKWQHIVLYNFQGGNDGAEPNGGLVFDAAGNLYGTTYFGGSQNTGTVFQLAPASGGWKESVLHAFSGVGDGAEPRAGLVIDHAGNLYGTTWGGGSFDGGAVFEISPGSNGWAESILYSFCSGSNGCSDGLSLLARLAFDSHGDLFGVTEFGGNGPYGTVFELKPGNGSWSEKTLHSFSGPDGGHPDFAGLTFDKAGNFYGTTASDGAFGNGTVFRFAPGAHGRWTPAILYNFRNPTGDGSLNFALTIDAAAHLYGADGTGGSGSCNNSSGCGLVYEVTPQAHRKSKYRNLHIFTGARDGGQPSGDPILGASGNLYGTAGIGGTKGHGVVYAVAP